MGQGARLQCPSTRAAWARPGPAATPCPAVHAPMQPSDSLPPSAPAPVPLAGGCPRCACLCCAPRADAACTRRRAVRRRRGTGSPRDRMIARRGEGLPGYGAILCVRALGAHPAGSVPLLAHRSQGYVVAFDGIQHSRHPARHRVRGRGPTARTFVCLRIPGRVSTPGARLATGSGGLTLGRAGFAPAGRHTKVHEGIASSNAL